MDRFFSEPNRIRRLSDEEIESSFLLEIDRRVSSDSVITIDQIEYEVDCRFAKQRIKLRYSPDFKDIFIVEADGTLTPIRLLNKTENSFVKREKFIYAEVKNNGLLYKIWSGIQSIYKEFQRNLSYNI